MVENDCRPSLDNECHGRRSQAAWPSHTVQHERRLRWLSSNKSRATRLRAPHFFLAIRPISGLMPRLWPRPTLLPLLQAGDVGQESSVALCIIAHLSENACQQCHVIRIDSVADRPFLTTNVRRIKTLLRANRTVGTFASPWHRIFMCSIERS
jgi:hypothetical protein